MPHVLFVTEKWCDADPRCGTTNSEHNLFGSLEASGLATYECIHFDEYFHRHGTKADDALLARLRRAPRPDVVVVTPLWGSDLTPRFRTYARIRATGIPLVLVCFDGSHDHTRRLAQEHAPLAVATLVLDLTDHDLFRDPRFVPLWTPQDTRIFHDPKVERTIDVSFVGSVARYPDRRQALAKLREAGIEVYQSGGQREHNLSVREYAAVHQKSRIALNFAREGGCDRTQVKGRVFEATLCGALLVEEENVHVKKWFEPGRDYVSFTDADDLIAKVRYYLSHEEERAAIARRGQEKAAGLYNETAFWGRILELAARRPPRLLGGAYGAELGRLLHKVRAQPLRRLPARVWRKVALLKGPG